MEFTLTIKGDAQELAALLSQIKVPAKAVTASIPLPGVIETPNYATGGTPVSEAPVQIEVAPLPIEEAVAATPAPATNGQVKATRTRKPPTVVTAPDEAPVATGTTGAPVVVSPGATSPGTTISHVPVTLDHLRKVMQTKLAHQAQIIEWLTGFGAKNLSTLDPSHYEDMYSKLNTLK